MEENKKLENETTELVEVENNELAEVEENNNGIKHIITAGIIVGVTCLVTHKVIIPAIKKVVKIASKHNSKTVEDEIIVEDSENFDPDKNQEEQK